MFQLPVRMPASGCGLEPFQEILRSFRHLWLQSYRGLEQIHFDFDKVKVKDTPRRCGTEQDPCAYAFVVRSRVRQSILKVKMFYPAQSVKSFESMCCDRPLLRRRYGPIAVQSFGKSVFCRRAVNEPRFRRMPPESLFPQPRSGIPQCLAVQYGMHNRSVLGP